MGAHPPSTPGGSTLVAAPPAPTLDGQPSSLVGVLLMVHLVLHAPAIGLLVLGAVTDGSGIAVVATTLGALILVVNVAAALLGVRRLLLS